MALEKMLQLPVLTVIVNTHNSPKTAENLDRCLASVARQEFNHPWELLIVNDGPSTEDTKATVRKYCDPEGAEDGDLFVLANGDTIPLIFFDAGDEPSGYQCYPKNQAINLAKGEFIRFLDFDNEFTDGSCQALFDAINEGKVWPDFSYGRRKYVIDFKEGEEEEVKVTLPEGHEITLNERESPFVEFNQENIQFLGQPMTNFIDTSDFMICKGTIWRMILSTGMAWNEGRRRFGDWEFIARLVYYAGGRGKGIDEIVQRYHWTGDNMQLTRPVNEVPDKKRVD